MEAVLRNGVEFSWLMPVDMQAQLDGRMTYGGDGAVHDDEQFNRRVAAMVNQVLRTQSA